MTEGGECGGGQKLRERGHKLKYKVLSYTGYGIKIIFPNNVINHKNIKYLKKTRNIFRKKNHVNIL